jgi:hypothetical protein
MFPGGFPSLWALTPELMVPRRARGLSLSEKQYHVPRRAGKKLSIFLRMPAIASLVINRPRLVTSPLAIGPRIVFSAAAAGAEFKARFHIQVQKGIEIA